MVEPCEFNFICASNQDGTHGAFVLLLRNPPAKSGRATPLTLLHDEEQPPFALLDKPDSGTQIPSF